MIFSCRKCLFFYPQMSVEDNPLMCCFVSTQNRNHRVIIFIKMSRRIQRGKPPTGTGKLIRFTHSFKASMILFLMHPFMSVNSTLQKKKKKSPLWHNRCFPTTDQSQLERGDCISNQNEIISCIFRGAGKSQSENETSRLVECT